MSQTSITSTPTQLLLVDDDEIDREAVVRGFEDAGLVAVIEVAQDGLEALEHLRARTRGCGVRLPLILLDLNMPRMGGLEFLQALRADPALRHAQVFVLSTSDKHEDVATAYALGVSGYLVKGRIGTAHATLAKMLAIYRNLIQPMPGPSPDPRG